MWSIVHEEPVEVDCNRCDGKGWVGVDRGGDPDWCPRCGGSGSDFLDLSELTTLAHNLAIAAGLCRAFDLGVEGCFTYCEHWYGPDGWKPGCGKAAP